MLSRLFVCLFCFVLAGLPAQAARNRAEDKTSQIEKIADIAYGTAELQKLDIYTSEQCRKQACPVVVWVHGGGWRMGDKSFRGAPNLAATWCPLGVVLVAINYRLSPDVVHPAHVQDVAAALNWVKGNITPYGGNPDKIYLLGHSAGAHLVALVATDPRYLGAYNMPLTALAGVFPIDSASYDLNSSINSAWVGRMVEQAFGKDPVLLSAASPLDLVHKHRNVAYPPFIMAAVKQRPDAVFQMNKLVEELQKAGGQAQGMVVDYPGRRQLQAHGDISKDLSDMSAAMTRRLMAEVGVLPNRDVK